MARRKANDLENQMSLMDMMASESPEYTEEGPEELLDPSEDTGDSDGQTDKPFKLVANKTTKAKASISTQALSVVKAVYADTVETNWEELFDGFDRLYAITFSSGIEFVNKVINKFSYAEVVFGCEKIIANDIAAIMSVQIDSVQRLAKSKSAGNLANRLDDGSLQLYICRTMCVSCITTTTWVMRVLVELRLRKSNWHGRQTRVSSGWTRSRIGSFIPIQRMDLGTN